MLPNTKEKDGRALQLRAAPPDGRTVVFSGLLSTFSKPLRLGGGGRLKIVEGMAMARPIVSTTLGAEGIDAVPERDILIADDGADFAAAVLRLLGDPGLGARLGRSARKLAMTKYARSSAAVTLGRFFREVIAARSPASEFSKPTGETA